MSDDPRPQRRRAIEEHIRKDQNLLGEYEDALRLSVIPGERTRYRQEIDRLRTSVAEYEAQLAALSAGSATPSAQRPIWNVPLRRNVNFTGREQTLEDLRTMLAGNQTSVIVQAIAGLGGVGKTQLAVEYAYRYAADYDVVWWVRAEDPISLVSDYAALAERLPLGEQDTRDQSVAVRAVRRWLEEHSCWLLIFDNALTGAALEDYLPAGGQGSILITSRNRNWGAYGEVLRLAPWSSTESVQFLLKRTGQNDEAAAAQLAARLGELPLAIEQAAAYIAEHATPLRSYLDLFEQHQLRLLDRSRPTNYHNTVQTTWSLAIKEIEELVPAAADLLTFCAFLDPDGIPLDLLPGAGEELPVALAACLADSLMREDAVGALLRYSLVEREGETLLVHRLVQAVTRERLGDAGQRDWAERAVRAIYVIFPDPQDFLNWPVCERLVSSARMVADRAESYRAAREWTAELLNQVAMYLLLRAPLAGSRGVLERVPSIKGAVYDSDHPGGSTALTNLGGVLRDVGDLPEARQRLERALSIKEGVYGPDHPEVARTLGNLGIVLRGLGDLREAHQRLERALSIKEGVYGPDHPEVARTLTSLGIVLQDLGDLREAHQRLERAFSINEAAYGPDHPEVARTLGNLGIVLRGLGDLREGHQRLERALSINEVAYGPDHPEVAVTLTSLGIVLQDLGDLREGHQRLERAFSINEAAYGPDHPEVAVTLTNLGIVLQDLGDLQRARQQYERALAIFRTRLGEDHRYTKIVLGNLAALAEAEQNSSAER